MLIMLSWTDTLYLEMARMVLTKLYYSLRYALVRGNW